MGVSGESVLYSEQCSVGNCVSRILIYLSCADVIAMFTHVTAGREASVRFRVPGATPEKKVFDGGECHVFAILTGALQYDPTGMTVFQRHAALREVLFRTFQQVTEKIPTLFPYTAAMNEAPRSDPAATPFVSTVGDPYSSPSSRRLSSANKGIWRLGENQRLVNSPY